MHTHTCIRTHTLAHKHTETLSREQAHRHVHTSVESHLGMSRSDCAEGYDGVDMTFGGHGKKQKKQQPWLRDLDLQCAATIAELIHLIYGLLCALRGPAAEEIVHWGCKYGWQEQLSSCGMRREWGSNRDDPDDWSRFLLIIGAPCVRRPQDLDTSSHIFYFRMQWCVDFSEHSINSCYITKCCDLLSWLIFTQQNVAVIHTDGVSDCKTKKLRGGGFFLFPPLKQFGSKRVKPPSLLCFTCQLSTDRDFTPDRMSENKM